MSTTTQKYLVRGMTCDHCASSVTAEVRSIPGVAEVAVDVAAGLVSVTGDQSVTAEQVREAVEEAGYGLVSNG